jgi:hypothetical protein
MSGSDGKTFSVLGWTGILWLDSLRGVSQVRRAPSLTGGCCHRQRRDGNGGQALGKMCTNIEGDLSFGWVEGCGDAVWGVGYSLCVRGGVLVDFSEFLREMLGVVFSKIVVHVVVFHVPNRFGPVRSIRQLTQWEAATAAWFGQLLLWHGESGATGMRLGGILCGY